MCTHLELRTILLAQSGKQFQPVRFSGRQIGEDKYLSILNINICPTDIIHVMWSWTSILPLFIFSSLHAYIEYLFGIIQAESTSLGYPSYKIPTLIIPYQNLGEEKAGRFIAGIGAINNVVRRSTLTIAWLIILPNLDEYAIGKLSNPPSWTRLFRFCHIIS